MDDFVDKKFEGHPAVVRELAIFQLADRVSSAQIACLESKLKACTEEASALKSRCDKLETANKELKRSLDSLINDVKQSKKKKE